MIRADPMQPETYLTKTNHMTYISPIGCYHQSNCVQKQFGSSRCSANPKQATSSWTGVFIQVETSPLLFHVSHLHPAGRLVAFSLHRDLQRKHELHAT